VRVANGHFDSNGDVNGGAQQLNARLCEFDAATSVTAAATIITDVYVFDCVAVAVAVAVTVTVAISGAVCNSARHLDRSDSVHRVGVAAVIKTRRKRMSAW
jgi:hypothetical protein